MSSRENTVVIEHTNACSVEKGIKDSVSSIYTQARYYVSEPDSSPASAAGSSALFLKLVWEPKKPAHSTC